MAQASSVQREPSMEEILASIRRIIEDSDQVGRKPGEGFQPLEQAAERGDRAVIDADAFRTELHGTTVRDASRPDDVATAGVGATLGKAREQAVPARENPFGTEPLSGRAKEAFGFQRTVSIDEPVRAEKNEAADAERSKADAIPSAASFSPLRPKIISEEPGKQVAAAFNELSEAFASSRRKSFDEIAEEMLRPMLQDWLDNNLPTLVERLVREEIERIARGE